jgi:hypothetical protein
VKFKLGIQMAYHHVSPTPLDEGGLKDFVSKAKIAEESNTNDKLDGPSVVTVQNRINECYSLNRRASIQALSIVFFTGII